MPKTIYAKHIEPGKIYQTNTKSKSLIRFGGGVVRNKAQVQTYVRGYGWQPIGMPEDAVLILLSAKEQKIADKNTGGKMAKAKVKAKTTAVKKNRLPKVGAGKAAPRVKLEGFDLRQHYRSRLHSNRAQDCARAKEDSCKCRCGGSLHGKNHKPWFEAESKLFDASKTGAVTAKDILALIKKFGGKNFKPHKHKAKPKAKAAKKKAKGKKKRK